MQMDGKGWLEKDCNVWARGHKG